MIRRTILWLFLACTTAVPVTGLAAPDTVPGLVTVTATRADLPPDWAVMQRRLIDTLNQSAREYYNTFVHPGGQIKSTGPWDDVLEMYVNWPLFYAIGGDQWFLDTALVEYNAITRQFSRRDPLFPDRFIKGGDWYQIQDPQLVREFPVSDDWFHNSEGLGLFYGFGLAAPDCPENIDRARRFAEMYMGLDPEAPNYDPEYRIIRSVMNGSAGPGFKVRPNTLPYLLDPQYQWVSLNPVIRELDPGWQDSERERARLEKVYNTVILQGDSPLNMLAIGLATNAYLYTGDEKYKAWITEYAGAWKDRIAAAGGVIPDNTDLKGRPGGNREGQWWGGFFGWTGRYSIHMIHGSCTVAAECAQLVTGDSSWLDLLRGQLDVLLAQAKTGPEGQLLVPYNHTLEGWTSYRPMHIRDLSHLWHASMAAEDSARVVHVRAGSKYLPLGYSRLYNRQPWEADGPFDWTAETVSTDRDDNMINEYPRLAYHLQGDNPDWPFKILQADWMMSQRRREQVRRVQGPDRVFGDGLYNHNPIITKGLEQTTMGCPQTVYNGGLSRARVRYFDTDRVRPGLPPDVAALVEVIRANRTVVRLVNLNPAETRHLIVQAGAFGEHRFTTVTVEEESSPVNGPYLGVELPAGTTILLDLGTELNVNRPSYAFPWQAR